MIEYKLKYEDLIQRNIHSDFKIVEISDDTIIQYCIDLFNSEINWDGMFNLQAAEDRIERGDKMFVSYYKGEIVGYCWLKCIDSTTYYIYNVFIKTTNYSRMYGATDMLFYVIQNYTNTNILTNIDDWNIRSINVFTKLGFEQL
jgi:hypothetical protein